MSTRDEVTCPFCEGSGRVTWPDRVGYWAVLVCAVLGGFMTTSLWLLRLAA